jgi:hypothetical protein
MLSKYLNVGGHISIRSEGERNYVCRCEAPDPNNGSKKSRSQVFQTLDHALEANPSGLTSTDLFHQVQGLSKHNSSIASLSLFLKSCPGIRHETSLDGRTLYSKEEHSKKRKAQVGDSPVDFKKTKMWSEALTDNDAALACLRALQGYDGPWPATIEEMERFVFGTAPNNRLERRSKDSVLVAWADFNVKGSSPRRVIKCLQQELIKTMKCLNVQGSSYTWNRGRVISILAQNSLDSNCPRPDDDTEESPEISCLRGAMEVQGAPMGTSSYGVSPRVRGEEDAQGPASRVPSASESPEGFDFVNAPNPSKINAAAVACLRILSGSARPWPSSGKDWKIFLLGKGRNANSSFHPPRGITSEPALTTWLRDQMRKVKGKTVRASLMNELVYMGCITLKKGQQIEWNQKYVRRVLAFNGTVAASGVDTGLSDMEKSGPGQTMAQSASGIESRNADGSPLPFQNTRSKLISKLKAKPRGVTDHDAVVACLRVLSGLKRPWPSKGSEWNVFVAGSAFNEFRPSSEIRQEPDLVKWLSKKVKATTNPRNVACRSLRAKLLEYGCISSVKGDKFIWQRAKVQRTLVGSKPDEDPNCVVDTTHSGRTGVGCS